MVDVLAKQMEGMEKMWDSFLENIRTCSTNTNHNTLWRVVKIGGIHEENCGCGFEMVGPVLHEIVSQQGSELGGVCEQGRQRNSR